MASPSTDTSIAQIAQALVEFSTQGSFPDEKVSTLKLEATVLPSAIEALANAKAKLEAEVHTINEETADDVRSWKANAQSVQDDITRSKTLANEIQRKADAPILTGQEIREAEEKAAFLIRELNYNQQVQRALKGIRAVNQILDQVEQARNERRILDALHLLEKSWTELDAIPASKSTRAIKLLDIRAFELKSDVHETLDHVWQTLVHVDVDNHKVSISSDREDEPMGLSDAVIGLRAYKEFDKRMNQLWHDFDKAILMPRMDSSRETLPSIHVEDSTLQLQGSTDKSIKSLFADLEKVLSFLVQRLPSDLLQAISNILMPELMPRITQVWLDAAVPSSLHDMDGFQDVIEVAKSFCATLKSLGFSNFGDLQEWVDSAPKVWLSKCREAALDTVRAKLSQGLGASKQVERVEKRMVSKSEGKQLAANGATASADGHGWDAAWSDGEEDAKMKEEGTAPTQENTAAEDDDDGADAWGWGDDDAAAEEDKPEEPQEEKNPDDEDDPTEAWGWGDDAANVEEEEQPNPIPSKPVLSAPKAKPQTRELTLKETYNISSMPQPVLDLIFAILEDGAALTDERFASSPVAAAASGLFNLPTLALAMFRAVSPYYYSTDIGGNMYLYNDASYLAERLADFVAGWKKRSDLSTRAQNMLRLDNDIKPLQNFANRAYSNEMSIQKTILRDLLGGEQNLMTQDETESCVTSAVARVRSMAVTWESILSRSAWQQAVGGLVDAVAAKITGDVMDMPAIGQEEAYNIASLIATVTELDDLFLPKDGQKGEEMVPTTAQYAASWLRLKYLSEVLQSNLRDVRYLWMESELSLYFTKDEVIDLINLSFEDNPRTREVIREITAHPRPLA
ncbi:hypothetical protein QBC46DRAFT_312993 [Diplogelasinospora grovesii]|uniref:ZW10 C-terminal helical domain-containing protein n=1 Tax=Diplogelasinospora grovesii TaxID=303347 RepID=A0AAN6N952_9PEZI|nr:hypothetical protein QBC46DRAFT_312993 [Diplogelasinospora grovesii]